MLRLALAEIRRAKLRFGLLIGAVALLVFLILFQQTLAARPARVLHRWAREPVGRGPRLQRRRRGSRRGQRRHAGAGGRGRRGRRRGPGGAVRRGDLHRRRRRGRARRHDGLRLRARRAGRAHHPGRGPAARARRRGGRERRGRRCRLRHRRRGQHRARRRAGRRSSASASDAQFSVQPTLYTTYATYEQLVVAGNPEAPSVLPTLVAVQPERGIDPEALAASINEAVEGVDASDAADGDREPAGRRIDHAVVRGDPAARVHRGRARHVGVLPDPHGAEDVVAHPAARGRREHRFLLANIALQVAIVAVAGIAPRRGCSLVLATEGERRPRGPADPGLILTTGAAILVLALVASLASMRRVAELDPGAATQRQAGGGLA